ncbi:MAG TPA: squalene synthase HpnC [Blastocatellia bacterium]|jgi:squalene synthase HpnC
MKTALQGKRVGPFFIGGSEFGRGQDWSVESSYKLCEQVAKSHYENFPVGSFLLPKRIRKHFYAIYAFARLADDMADEETNGALSPDGRLEMLGLWREMLIRSFDSQPAHPVFIALRKTAAEFDLPKVLFEELLSAFAQDVTTGRYKTFDDLRDYCRRSANPVGRLILLLFGHRDPQLFEWSDSICTALQLANHWQDVSVDLIKDRIYIPAEDMARFGVREPDLALRPAPEAFRELMRFEVARARELFLLGRPLCASVTGRLAVELRVVWLAGMKVLKRIEESGYDVLTSRPAIGNAERLLMIWPAIRKGAFLKQE